MMLTPADATADAALYMPRGSAPDVRVTLVDVDLYPARDATVYEPFFARVICFLLPKRLR
jgi:hypothetical protein